MKELKGLADTELTRREFLQGLSAVALAILTAGQSKNLSAAAYENPAMTPTFQNVLPENYNLNELVADADPTFGSVNFATLDEAQLYLPLQKKTISFSPVETVHDYDSALFETPSTGLTVWKSGLNGSLTGVTHSGFDRINGTRTALPAQPFLEFAEGNREMGYASFGQISERIKPLLNPPSDDQQPLQAIVQGGGTQERAQLVDVQAFYPPSAYLPFPMDRTISSYLFAQGDPLKTPDELNLFFCGTSAPIAVGLFQNKFINTPDTNIEDVKTALKDLSNPHASLQQTKNAIVNVLYPRLLVREPANARLYLAQYNGCIKKGDQLIPLNKQQLLDEFGIYFYNYMRYVWKFRRIPSQ